MTLETDRLHLKQQSAIILTLHVQPGLDQHGFLARMKNSDLRSLQASRKAVFTCHELIGDGPR